MFIQEKITELNHRLGALKDRKNTVIWGAGVHTANLFEKTDLLDYNIANIVDMDPGKQGKKYFGYMVKAPGQISWNETETVVISVPGREAGITEMLQGDFHYQGQIIKLYEEGETTPFYKLYDREKAAVYVEGDYGNWAEAYRACKGYEDQNILSRVADAVLKVISGEAAWERDGCLFYEQKYVYRICAAILRCAVKNHNKGVRVFDLGGALGSTYFQNRQYLSDVHHLEYIIAEQTNYADYGRENLENETLKFIDSGDDYSHLGMMDIVLISGSLQFIYPYEDIISRILRMKPRYIILDRIMVGGKRRICREIVTNYKSTGGSLSDRREKSIKRRR